MKQPGKKPSPGDPTHPSTWQATTPSSKGHMAWHDMTWQFNTMQNIYIHMRILHILWPWLFPDLSNVTTKQILEKKTPSPPSPPPCYRPDTWQPPLFELLAVASVRHKPSKWRGHTALFEWVQVRLGEETKTSPQKKSLAQKKKHNVVMFFFKFQKGGSISPCQNKLQKPGTGAETGALFHPFPFPTCTTKKPKQMGQVGNSSDVSGAFYRWATWNKPWDDMNLWKILVGSASLIFTNWFIKESCHITEYDVIAFFMNSK